MSKAAVPTGATPVPNTTPSAPIEVWIAREPDCGDLPLPEYATAGAAGVDLRAAVPEGAPVTLAPGAWALVPTGLRMALPAGIEAQVRPRSGLALKHGLGVLNSPGTVDEDYRGVVGVILFNFGSEPFVIRRGERIAQMVFNRVERVRFHAVASADALPASERGDGGFGHTGR